MFADGLLIDRDSMSIFVEELLAKNVFCFFSADVSLPDFTPRDPHRGIWIKPIVRNGFVYQVTFHKCDTTPEGFRLVAHVPAELFCCRNWQAVAASEIMAVVAEAARQFGIFPSHYLRHP